MSGFPWDRTYRRRVLDPSLNWAALVTASQIQLAQEPATVSELIEATGIGRDIWYVPDEDATPVGVNKAELERLEQLQAELLGYLHGKGSGNGASH